MAANSQDIGGWLDRLVQQGQLQRAKTREIYESADRNPSVRPPANSAFNRLGVSTPSGAGAAARTPERSDAGGGARETPPTPTSATRSMGDAASVTSVGSEYTASKGRPAAAPPVQAAPETVRKPVDETGPLAMSTPVMAAAAEPKPAASGRQRSRRSSVSDSVDDGASPQGRAPSVGAGSAISSLDAEILSLLQHRRSATVATNIDAHSDGGRSRSPSRLTQRHSKCVDHDHGPRPTSPHSRAKSPASSRARSPHGHRVDASETSSVDAEALARAATRRSNELYQMAKDLTAKREALHETRGAEHSHQPNVNRRGNPAAPRTPGEDTNLQLFEAAPYFERLRKEHRQALIAEEMKNCTFRPDINDYQPVEQKGYYEDQDFVDRTMAWQRQRDENRDVKRMQKLRDEKLEGDAVKYHRFVARPSPPRHDLLNMNPAHREEVREHERDALIGDHRPRAKSPKRAASPTKRDTSPVKHRRSAGGAAEPARTASTGTSTGAPGKSASLASTAPVQSSARPVSPGPNRTQQPQQPQRAHVSFDTPERMGDTQNNLSLAQRLDISSHIDRMEVARVRHEIATDPVPWTLESGYKKERLANPQYTNDPEVVEAALQRPVPYSPIDIANLDHRHNYNENDFYKETQICPYCGSEVEHYYLHAIGRRADKGVSANIPPTVSSTECQTEVLPDPRDERLAAMAEQVKQAMTLINYLRAELEKAKRNVKKEEVPIYIDRIVERVVVKEPPPKPLTLDQGVDTTDLPRPEPEPVRAPTPPHVEPDPPPPTPSAAAAPPEKKNHRQAIMEASRDINLLMEKVKTAVGDSVRMKAAVSRAKDVLLRIRNILASLQEAMPVDDEDNSKYQQIVDLNNNIGLLTADMETQARQLAQNPKDQELLALFSKTLKQLGDTADIALSKGTSYAVNADLADAVAKVPMFDGVSNPGFFNMLIRKMEERVFPPGKSVVNFGETGSSMYFITKGTVKILSEANVKVATLTEGQFFGEICALIGGERTATVMAETYVEAYELDKSTLTMALEKYPQFVEHFHKVAEQRLKDNTRRKGSHGVNSQGIKSIKCRPRLEAILQELSKARSEVHSRDGVGRAREATKQLMTLLSEIDSLATVEFLHGDLASAQTLCSKGLVSMSEANVMDCITTFETAVRQGYRAIAMEEMQEHLGRLPDLKGTPATFLARLMRGVEVTWYPENSTVVTAGDALDALFLITQGSVSVTLPGGNKVSTKFQEEMFGETMFHSEEPHQTTVTTMARSEICRLPRSVFDAAMQEDSNVRGILDANRTKVSAQDDTDTKRASGLLKSVERFRSLKKGGAAAAANKNEVRIVDEKMKAVTEISENDIKELPLPELERHRAALRDMLAMITKYIENPVSKPAARRPGMTLSDLVAEMKKNPGGGSAADKSPSSAAANMKAMANVLRAKK